MSDDENNLYVNFPIQYINLSPFVYYMNHKLMIYSSDVTSTPIENTGIKTGEITGWRIWRLSGSTNDPILRSFFIDYEWRPFQTECGDPKDDNHAGIWSFKEQRSAMLKFDNSPEIVFSGLVVGTIKMWGSVIEHEIGYRAEKAKITGIENLRLYKSSFLEKESRLFSFHNQEKIIDNLRYKYLGIKP